MNGRQQALLRELVRAGELPEEVLHGGQRSLLQEPDEALGQTVLVERGQLVPVLRSRGASQRGDNCSVTFGLDVQPGDIPPGLTRQAYILATLRWGNGAGQVVAECDWHQGTQVSIVAGTLDVSARFESDYAPNVDGVMVPSGVFAVGTYFRARVTAAVTRGTRPARSYPTRTFPNFSLGAGVRVRYPIPLFAFAMQLNTPEIPVLPAATLLVTFQGGTRADDGIQQRVPGEDFSTPVVRSSEGIRFNDASRFVEIRNLGLAPIVIGPYFALNV